MSFRPPYSVDPNAPPLNLPPWNYPGVSKGIPTSGGFAPSQPGPTQIHLPALGSWTPAQTQTVPVSHTPTLATAASSDTSSQDPYIQSLQSALKADQALEQHPYQQPQYKPPAKGLEYLAAGLAVLFPGSPIASMASGVAGGLYERSQQQYVRAEQAEQQRVAAQERTAQIANTIADAQASIQQRREAVDTRHSETLDRLQQQQQEFGQTFTLKSATLDARIRYENGQLANMAARNTITQEDAQLAATTRYQVAIMQQAGLDRRNASNAALRALIARAQSSTTQADQQLKALDTAVSSGAMDAATAQTQAQAIIGQNQQTVTSLLSQAAAAAPHDTQLSGASNLGVSPPMQQPYAWPAPQSSAPAESAPPTGALPMTTQVPGMTLPGETNALGGAAPAAAPAAAPEPFPGHPSLGHGAGAPEQMFGQVKDYYTKHAGAFATQDDLLHFLAQNGGADLSAPQIQQIVQVWQNTHNAHTLQHQNPAAASTKGAIKTSQASLNGYAAESTGVQPQTAPWLTNAVHSVENFLTNANKPLSLGQQVSFGKPIIERADAAETQPQHPHTLLDAITQTAKNTQGLGEPGVPLLRALIAAESGDNPNAVSSAGAQGLGQLMPETAKAMGVKNPKDPMQNLQGAAKYLSQLLNRFHSIPLALAAYNAGPTAVAKYHGIPPYPETQAYVRRVISIYNQLTRQ